ncbi:MaoC family dehydratase [Rhodococcus erythropolis]|uniref:MaoC family dehydratase n=1 Tax=Rhodococcus erythropolis TaxID=1833 RepID=UPI003799BF8E
MRIFESADDILSSVGETLGHSEWLTITQDRVDAFALATGDRQWIHVDVERAQAESPYGGTIAHGYLTLSLLPTLGWQIYETKNAKMGVNYGSDKVRFPAPVPVGASIRLTSVLGSAERTPDGAVRMVVHQTIEARDIDKPVLVAETISRIVF